MKESQASFVDTIPKPLLLVITIAFAVLTAFSIIDFGVLAIFTEATQNTATLQIFVDLILCALFIIVWLRHDTRYRTKLSALGNHHPRDWCVRTPTLFVDSKIMTF